MTEPDPDEPPNEAAPPAGEELPAVAAGGDLDDSQTTNPDQTQALQADHSETKAPPGLQMELPETPSRSLEEAIERFGLPIAKEVCPLLSAYCDVLWDWNTKVNLTRHTDYDTFVRRDCLDSFMLAGQLAADEDILDIGTGGGVPGIVLAIIRPDLNVSLCDSVGKKAKVVDDIVQKLELNVTVYGSRAQDVLEDMRFHSCVTRAAGSIKQLLNWLSDVWLGTDRLLAIKGPRWVAERGEARHLGLMNKIELRKLASYPMPGTNSESCILQFKRMRDA